MVLNLLNRLGSIRRKRQSTKEAKRHVRNAIATLRDNDKELSNLAITVLKDVDKDAGQIEIRFFDLLNSYERAAKQLDEVLEGKTA